MIGLIVVGKLVVMVRILSLCMRVCLFSFLLVRLFSAIRLVLELLFMKIAFWVLMYWVRVCSNNGWNCLVVN